MARRVQAAEQSIDWLVGVLRLWHPGCGLPGDRPARLRSRQTLPRQAVQGKRTRNALVLLERNLRDIRCQATHHAAKGCRREPAMKSVGKLDAGNPHVPFDERGRETGRCRMAQATAPFLDSTMFVMSTLQLLRIPIDSRYQTFCLWRFRALSIRSMHHKRDR